MKTSAPTHLAITAFLLQLLLLTNYSANAQARYDFRNAVRISGTDRQVGALYRFPNVRTGVDALVSITAITGGLTINTLDGTSSGFAEAFQPIITLPAHSNGYAEFNITFVTAATSTPVVQTEVPITPIDVDGEAGRVYEFDEIFRSASSYVDYDLTGDEVQLSYPEASLVRGVNTGGITYDGVDTTAKEVMFSVVNANISSVIIRVGANNVSNQSRQRLRSVYFQKFGYPNSVLAISSFRIPGANNTPGSRPSLKVFPTVFTSTLNVSFISTLSGLATFRLVDFSGKLIKLQTIAVWPGNNRITIYSLGNLPAGNYVALITKGRITYMQKVIKE